MQALFARPHLRRYFPEYELYIWIDADAWLADRRALELLLQGGWEDGLAIVAEVHPAYKVLYRPSAEAKPTLFKCYAAVWGERTAQEIMALPLLNGGVWAMRHDHPCWDKWAANLRHALKRTPHLLMEQCALNLTIYSEKMVVGLLPAWCNWICHRATPRYDAAKRQFQEPIRPYVPLSIIHAAALKMATGTYKTASGETREVPFDYLSLKGAKVVAPTA